MMAKHSRRRRTRMNHATASLGNLLGLLSVRVKNVTRQRAEVSREISGFIRHAQGMLSQLARQEMSLPGLNSPSNGKPGRKAGYKASAAARRKMSIAAKKRWAARRAAGHNRLG
jgi:hypothetical protein